jgi:hypothetical protein
MITLKLDPKELQFAINAMNAAQIMGKDAHVVSKCLTKFENKFADFQKQMQNQA